MTGGREKDDGRAQSLVALRSGIASAQFDRSIHQAQAEGQSVPLASQVGQGELSDSGPSERTIDERPLVRRLGRRLLRAFRPLAVPLLHRMQLRLSHAVEGSSTLQHQTVLIRDVRDFLGHLRWELMHSLQIHDTSNGVYKRLERIEDELAGLRNLSIANLSALTTLTGQGHEVPRDGLASSNSASSVVPADIDIRIQSHLRDFLRERVEQRQLLESILRSRIVPLGEEVLIRTSFGWLLVPKDDHAIITTMGELGDALEPGTVHVIRSILRPGDLAIDVGANVGGLLLPMAASIGPDGLLIACEPSPTCMQALRKTAVLNGLGPSLILHQVAVGSADGVATLYLGSNSSLNSIVALPEATGTIAVQIRRLDDIVPADRRPGLVKIDVEGLELEVLRGMHQILGRSPDIALIAEFGPTHLARNGISPAEWVAEFESFGFTLFVINEKDGTVNRASVPSLQDVYSVNILMVRQDVARWPQLSVAS